MAAKNKAEKNEKRLRKYCIIGIIAAVIGVVVAVHSCQSRVEPDLIITYVGEGYFDSQTFYEKIPSLEENIEDINNDGQRKIELVCVSLTSNASAAQEQANLSRLTISMGQGESRIYIMDKAYCLRYEDDEILADLSEYLPDGADALVNSQGKIYAIGVEGNSVLEELGLFDTENVYIALRAITEMDYVNFKSPTPEEIDKTARNVIEQIIK